MSLRRLYCPSLHPGRLELSKEESHHLVHVLRERKGGQVLLFDGRGREARGIIFSTHSRAVIVEVSTVEERPFQLRRRLTLAVAAPKAHRQSYLIEKCTELGVVGIWPILSERSVSRPNAPVLEKWRRRAVEAAKQCEQSWVPNIELVQTFDRAVNRCGEFDAACLSHPDVSVGSFQKFLVDQLAGSGVLVFIGPEGGWTDHELHLARSAGVKPVTLGPHILRTETAAVAACAAVALISD